MEFSEKQVQIMEAAEKLFSERGFDGTPVRDIAEQAGVNLAMISYYFGSKEKLMESLFSYRGQFIKQQLEGMLQDSEMSPLDKVYRLIDHYIERFQKQQCFHRIMTREQMHSTKGSIGELILNLKRTNLELVKQLIVEGQKKGVFKKNIDISLMMATLVGTVNHVLSTQHYYREINGMEDMPADLFDRHIKKKLSTHLKLLFKATLTYEV